MKTRISLWALAALVLLSSGGCAIKRDRDRIHANTATCSAALQADPVWKATPGYTITYSSANFDASRVVVEAGVPASSRSWIATFFAFKPKAPKKNVTAECLFDGATLQSWHWVSDLPKPDEPKK
jgi:hypothetical protein